MGVQKSAYKEDKEKYVASHPSQYANGMRRFRFDPNLKKECHIINGGDDCILDGVTHIPSNEHFYEKRENVVHDMFMIGFCCIFVAHKKS